MAANLSTIPVILEEEGTSVKELFLDGNNLAKLSDYGFYNSGFHHVKKLSLRNSNIKVMSEKLFFNLTSLESLDLSGNLLFMLHPHQFDFLPALRSLDLSHNTLSYLASTTFTSVSSCLSHLSLAGNILATLPSSIFPLLYTLTTLDMSSNPWTCDCMLAELHSGLALANTIPEQIMCSSPLALLDKSWEQLDTSAFLCSPVVTVQELVASQSGQTANLPCKVRASPGTEVVWLDGDRVIQHLGHPGQGRDPHLHQSYSLTLEEYAPGKYLTTFLSVLSIHNISESSTGFYTCLAWNNVGMEQKTVTLSLEEIMGARSQSSVTLIVGVTSVIIIILFLVVMITILCYCRSIKGAYDVGMDIKTFANERISDDDVAEDKFTNEKGLKTLSRHSTDVTFVSTENIEGGNCEAARTTPVGCSSLPRSLSDQTAQTRLVHTCQQHSQAMSVDNLAAMTSLVSHLPHTCTSLGTVPVHTTEQAYSCASHHQQHHPHVPSYATMPRRYSSHHQPYLSGIGMSSGHFHNTSGTSELNPLPKNLVQPQPRHYALLHSSPSRHSSPTKTQHLVVISEAVEL